MKPFRHFFFDMDKTIAPPRQPIHKEMYNLLNNFEHDIVIVSGQDVKKISWQTNNLQSYILGQNGNHALDPKANELWNFSLSDKYKAEILAHIDLIKNALDHDLNYEWDPIEDRGAQITFSPIGNTAPVELKRVYDPDTKKRLELLSQYPFESDDLIVKIGGSTSLDYIHKDYHKGTNVKRLIEKLQWNPDDCVYYGDGLYPGGNDELVIGIIETILVADEDDTYNKLRRINRLA